MVTIKVTMSQMEADRLQLLAKKELRTANEQIRYQLTQGFNEQRIPRGIKPEDLEGCPQLDLA